MARLPGRDAITVHKKGMVQVDAFNKDVRRNTDAIGPGVYHRDEGTAFGDQVGGHFL